MTGSAAAEGTSWLFVPGDREERFAKALAAGADQVICDLEDAVDPSRRQHAREQVAHLLEQSGPSVWVRVNAAGTEAHDADVRALAGRPGLRGVVLAKAEAPEVVASLRAALDRPVLALVETVRGVRAADALGEAADRLAFGALDYSVDLGCSETPEALLHARSALVVASRLAGIPTPVDGVTAAVRDPHAVSVDAARARDLGFGGKLCIHPLQLDPVHTAFAPTDAELAWAREVLEAATSDGAVLVAGRMVDRPVLELARRHLAHARPDTGGEQ